MDKTGIITDEDKALAVRRALSALDAVGVHSKVFDMVMGIQYQTRHQWLSASRPPQRDYVYWAIRQLERVVRVLSETGEFNVDQSMERHERNRRHAAIIRKHLAEVA